MIPVPVCSPRVVVLDLAVQGPDAEVQQHGQREHDGGVAEGEEEADAQRPLAVVDQLAGGVVDGGDVVGVERVPHAQGVGQDPGPEAEDLGSGDVVVPADGGGQQPPAEHVQPDDHRPAIAPARAHSGRGQPVTDPGKAGTRVSHGGTFLRAAGHGQSRNAAIRLQ